MTKKSSKNCMFYSYVSLSAQIYQKTETPLAMAGFITSRLLMLVGGPLCPGY